MRPSAFLIEFVRSIIPNQRIRHRHDLTAIGRIGQHFLIAGHGSVKANLADARARCAK